MPIHFKKPIFDQCWHDCETWILTRFTKRKLSQISARAKERSMLGKGRKRPNHKDQRDLGTGGSGEAAFHGVLQTIRDQGEDRKDIQRITGINRQNTDQLDRSWWKDLLLKSTLYHDLKMPYGHTIGLADTDSYQYNTGYSWQTHRYAHDTHKQRNRAPRLLGHVSHDFLLSLFTTFHEYSILSWTRDTEFTR